MQQKQKCGNHQTSLKYKHTAPPRLTQKAKVCLKSQPSEKAKAQRKRSLTLIKTRRVNSTHQTRKSTAYQSRQSKARHLLTPHAETKTAAHLAQTNKAIIPQKSKSKKPKSYKPNTYYAQANKAASLYRNSHTDINKYKPHHVRASAEQIQEKRLAKSLAGNIPSGT